MDSNDAALQWAQANPKDPRAQTVMAKAWAVKNPDDPRSTQILSKLAGTVAQAQNPQTAPDSADKAAQNGNPDAKPTTLQTQDSPLSRITDPQRWRAIITGGGPYGQKSVGSDLGLATMAIPAEAAPDAIASIAGYLGKSGIGPAAARITANTGLGAAQGAASNPEDMGAGAKTGAMVGGLLGAGGEAVQGLLSAGKWGAGKLSRMTSPQADAYVADPKAVGSMVDSLEDQSKMPELQDRAVDAINTSRAALKAKGLGNASQLRQALDGKNVTVNPKELLGLDPRADGILQGNLSRQSGVSESSPGEVEVNLGPGNRSYQMPSTQDPIPSSLEIPANDANQIKRYLQEGANFGAGTVTDPIQAAKSKVLAQASQGMRASIEQAAPEAGDLNKSMQDSMMLQNALRKGAKNSPLAYISSQSPDRVATMARAEDAGGGGLLDFGNKLGAAKTMTSPDSGSGIPSFLVKLAGRLGLRASDVAQKLAPAVAPATTQSLFSKPSE